MQQKFAIALYLLIWLSKHCVAQEVGFPLIRNYTPKEYKGTASIYSILQDKNTDIMYFGAFDLGLLSYDGARWNTIPTPNKTVAFGLEQDKNGRIYVAAIDYFGYLTTNEQGKTTFNSLTNRISDSTLKIGVVWSVKITGESVYFLTHNTLFQYFPKKDSISSIKAENNGVFRGDFVYNDTYYVRLSKKGLMYVKDGVLMPAPQSQFFNTENAFNKGAVPIEGSKYLIATRTEGLFQYDVERDVLPQPFVIEDADFLKGNDIYTAFSTDHYLALGSAKMGILLIDKNGKTLQRYNEGNFLQNNGITTINIDKNQNIWVDMSIGISKTEHGQDISYWDKNAGLKGVVLDVKRLQDRLYVLTTQNIYYLSGQSKPTEIGDIPVGDNWLIKEVQIDEKNMVLAGTQFGIFDIQGNQAKPVQKALHASIICQSKRNPKRIISIDNANLFSMVYDDGKWVYEGKWQGVNDIVFYIEEDNQGDFWLGTLNNGIIRITPSEDDITKPKLVKYYKEKEGIPSLNRCRVFRLGDRLVFGTEKGLYAYNSESDRFEPFEGLGKEFTNGARGVAFLQEMPNGRIYIASANNKQEDIGYLEPDNSGKYHWVYAPFRRIPEFAEIKSMHIEKTGVFWLGGSEGLFRYDATKDQKDYLKEFSCLIRKVSTGDDSIVYYGNPILTKKTNHAIRLEYAHNELKFEFAAPFFDQEERTTYSYILEGNDQSWSAWSRQTEKEYTNLWEGTYTFKVKAKNVYDIESKVASFQLKIMPPLYRTAWAYAGYVVFLISLIAGLLSWNTRRLNNVKERLERIVELRTAEVVKQKEEILAQSANLKMANTEIMQQKAEIESQSDSLRSANEHISLQKEELEKHFENLSVIVQVGKEVTASLNLENIIDKVYHYVNSLMDATEFGIGFYKPEDNTIDYNLYIMKGKRLYGLVSKIDQDRFSAWVVKNKKSIWLHDIQQEYKAFLPSLSAYSDSDLLVSLICLPLMVEDRIIGVMSVQSPQKAAYNTYHFDMLEALSAYVSVALDNSNAYSQLRKSNLELEEKVEKRTQQIKQAFEELLLAHQQLDTLSYRSAHDLRGPIARLQGLCYVAKLEQPAGTHDPYLQKIAEEADKMDKLLNRIMLTQTIKTKQVFGEHVVMADLVSEAVNNIRTDATMKKIDIKMADLPNTVLYTDRFLVYYLVKNVLDNSIRFSNHNSNHPFVEITLTDTPSEIWLSVLDNGIGVPKEVKNKIFDMFFVGHETLRGVGLGLFDAFTIAEKLKGKITLSDRSDGLTEFVIVLPKKADFTHWAQMIS